MTDKLSASARPTTRGVTFPVSPLSGGATPTDSRAFQRFLVFAIVLSIAFAKPLFDLLQLALRSSLWSHLPLIPVITGYLLWIRRQDLKTHLGGARWPGVALALAAVGMLVLAFLGRAAPDRLSAFMCAYCFLVWSGGFMILGGRFLRAVTFPALFLICMVPLPPAWVLAVESFLQHSSAEVAYWMLQLAGIPVLRTGTVFQMPGLTIEVAPECSGIRSSLVLFLTALLASHMFLRTTWKRALLVLLVVPLGIVRNGFRILVLSMLCVYVDPSYIHSPIHHKGGPIFFVLSLIPFAAVLVWLWKSENRPGPSQSYS